MVRKNRSIFPEVWMELYIKELACRFGLPTMCVDGGPERSIYMLSVRLIADVEYRVEK